MFCVKLTHTVTSPQHINTDEHSMRAKIVWLMMPAISFLVGAAGSCAQRYTTRTKMEEKWEYNLLVRSPNTECAECEAALNGLGKDGWELVTNENVVPRIICVERKKTQTTIKPIGS